MDEEWLPVEGFEGFYEVSSLGRVRSLDRKYHPGRVLKGVPLASQRHLRVALRKDGRSHWKFIHRIVATAFIENPNQYECVLHWDDDPTNNQVSNLRWGSRSDNTNDMVRNGLHFNASKTHCPEGHLYSEENTYNRRDTGARRCKTCVLAQNRAGTIERRLSSLT